MSYIDRTGNKISARPIRQYDNYAIYKRFRGLYEVTKDGQCFTQRAGIKGAHRSIIENMLSEIYTEPEINVWMESENILLNGKTALQLINDKQSSEVIAVVNRLLGLVYA